MRLSCGIVQDLLPLYEDGLCGEESRAAIEEHLRECSSCQSLLSGMRALEEPDHPAQASEDRAVLRAFRKIRRRWAVSLMAALLIVPVIFLSANQIRREGVCFTNIDDIVRAGGYMRALESQDWERAAAHIDYKKQYNETRALLGMTAEELLPRFVPVTIGQREWMAAEPYYQSYLQDLEDGDLFWDQAVFNYAFPLVPLDGWEMLKAEMPESFMEDGKDEVALTENFGEICYGRMETKWGTFMVQQSSEVWQCTSAYDFCTALELVPAEIYEEAAAAFAKAAQEQYDYIQARYGPFADMSPEEYRESRRDCYIQNLAACAEDGYRFEDPRYEGSEYIYVDGVGCWDITYGMDVLREGESYTVHLAQIVSNGKIVHISLSWSAELPDRSILSDALALS